MALPKTGFLSRRNKIIIPRPFRKIGRKCSQLLSTEQRDGFGASKFEKCDFDTTRAFPLFLTPFFSIATYSRSLYDGQGQHFCGCGCSNNAIILFYSPIRERKVCAFNGEYFCICSAQKGHKKGFFFLSVTPRFYYVSCPKREEKRRVYDADCALCILGDFRLGEKTRKKVFDTRTKLLGDKNMDLQKQMISYPKKEDDDGDEIEGWGNLSRRSGLICWTGNASQKVCPFSKISTGAITFFGKG